MRDAEREIRGGPASGSPVGSPRPGQGNTAARGGLAFEVENRTFTRVNTRIPVEFKFFSNLRTDPRLDRVYRGTTSNLSAGGLLLQGVVPDPSWIRELLLGRMVLGLKAELPHQPEPVKAMARVVWIEDPERRGNPHRLGVRFREITRDDQDRLLRFVLDRQMGS